ncbi:hypothetical protein FIE12Z_5229 [Fusarium flagelliforme]|uniref:Uncharacterized protein n=1 Tax=Fusarium flagelliforme TaxID=2675880 RepID=A0A395MRA5_9HYPO|nr:hypothetical protein FIE12Z_5229 [Fusarium flagelliforme]
MASQSNNSTANSADVPSGNGANRTASQAIEPSIFASRDGEGRGGTSRFGGFALAPGVGNTPAVLPSSAPVAPTAAPPTVGSGSGFGSGTRGRGNGRGRGTYRGRSSSRGRGNSGRGSYGGISRASDQPSVAVRPGLHSVPNPFPRPAATTSTERSITFPFNSAEGFATQAQQFIDETLASEYLVTFHYPPGTSGPNRIYRAIVRRCHVCGRANDSS